MSIRKILVWEERVRYCTMYIMSVREILVWEERVRYCTM